MSALRGVGAVALLAPAALVQGSIVPRLPWPGPGEPQLAALAVLAVALVAGARAGAVCGFGTGLLLDLLPPATHALGQWAFVLCLLGYLVGRLAADVVDSALIVVAIATVGAALAPLVFHAVGLTLGDPRADPVGALERLPSVALWTLMLAVLALPVWRRHRAEPPILLEATTLRGPLAVR
ncbi:MAG TPA: rod shape-determining protein MreD [Sporichthya sp.]|nr:rod shape-determining protein MreD [Sporichthya sp.]